MGVGRLPAQTMLLGLLALLPPRYVARAQELTGVNLAGPAFAAERLPGRFGFDFVYPIPAEIDYFTHKGMNVLRLSVLWERLQPTLGGELDPAELARLSGFVAAAEKAGAKVIVDLHNYGEYRGGRIGSKAVPVSAFVDVWLRLGRRFGQDSAVIFGLMNEPKHENAGAWAATVQQVVTAMRDAGAQNSLLLPGIGWDGAYNFLKLNASSLGAVQDPLRRSALEVHQYFDRNSSGIDDTCILPDEAVGRLTAMTAWLRSSGWKGFLGEFGVSRRPECLEVLRQVVGFLQSNKDVWQGWTYWAAGPLWGEYMFTLEPQGRADRPQMQVLSPFLRR